MNKIQANSISMVLNPCYSGGFSALEGANRVIMTACSADQEAYSTNDRYYDEFSYYWISAMVGRFPNGTTVNADANNDGFVSMEEAFLFAKNHDKHAAIKDAQVYGRGGDYERNIRGKGSVVVFASGNQGNNSVNLYGQYAICVGALGADGQLAINRETNRRYSNIGPGSDLVAFGGHMDKDKDNDGFNDGDIYTLRLHDKYTSTFTGTSAACPQVSGVAALMLSVNPNLTAKQVEDILFRTATDMGPKGRDDSYGHGLVNAFEAVKESLLETAFVDFSFEDGILEKTDEDILTFTLKKDRGNLNALTVYKADRYKLSLTLPYITDLAWLIKDGISKYTSYNDGKNWYEVKHENGQTIITTYYFYIRYILGGQRIPQWFPTDPTTGKNFLVRRKVPQSLKLNNTQNTNTKAYASSEILLQPGFEVKQGTVFETVFTNDIDEYKVLNCK